MSASRIQGYMARLLSVDVHNFYAIAPSVAYGARRRRRHMHRHSNNHAAGALNESPAPLWQLETHRRLGPEALYCRSPQSGSLYARVSD